MTLAKSAFVLERSGKVLEILERSRKKSDMSVKRQPSPLVLIGKLKEGPTRDAAPAWLTSGGAEAKGCIKGAIVGGVAGHMAGHGKLGAAAGCVIGHHEANKSDPNKANAQQPARQK